MSVQSEGKIYKIGQAAKLVGLKSYVLRFWEGEFEQLRPIRTDSGQRLYNDEHIALISRIKRLLHDEGLTIEGARKRLDFPDSSTSIGSPDGGDADETSAVRQLSLFGDGDRNGCSDKSILKEVQKELLVLRDLLR